MFILFRLLSRSVALVVSLDVKGMFHVNQRFPQPIHAPKAQRDLSDSLPAL